MENLQNKLMKRSKVLSVVLTVFWILYAALGLYFVYMLLVMLSWDGDTTLAQHMSETWQSSASPAIAERTVAQWRIMLLFGIGELALGGATDFISARAFHNISGTGEPFALKTVGRLKTAAWLIAAYIPYMTAVWIFTSSVLPGYSVSYSLSMGGQLLKGIMLAVLFFALVSVFQYGAELQRLSDETL